MDMCLYYFMNTAERYLCEIYEMSAGSESACSVSESFYER